MSKPNKQKCLKAMAERKVDMVQEIVFTTTTERFQAYWKEMKRHENELARIYGKDTKHICQPEIIGSVRHVNSNKVIVQFKRCFLCLKDME